MTIEEIKSLMVVNFSEFSNATIAHYLDECAELLGKMVTIAPALLDVVDKLEYELERRRG